MESESDEARQCLAIANVIIGTLDANAHKCLGEMRYERAHETW